MTNPYETNIDRLHMSAKETSARIDIPDERRSQSSCSSADRHSDAADRYKDPGLDEDFLKHMLTSAAEKGYGGSPTHSSRGSSSSEDDRDGERDHNHAKEESNREDDAHKLKLQKQNVLMDLERLKQKGIQLSKNYTLDDSIDDMRFEMKRHLMHAEECSSVAFMKDALGLACNGIEMLNNRMGPILALDGWATEVNQSIDKYDPAMEKLYRKYWKKPIGMGSPEMELAIGIFGAMGMHHFKTKMGMKQRMPTFGFPKVQPTGRQYQNRKSSTRFDELDSDEEGPP